MTRRIRLLVEVDAVVYNEDMGEDELTAGAMGYLESIIREAEDKAGDDAVNGEIFPLSYTLDGEDLTVWTPAGYIGALLGIRRMSRTARARLRKFDRLPAATRKALAYQRIRRRLAGSGIFATCPNCGAHRKIGDQRIHGLVYDPSVPCPKCGHMGSPPTRPFP